MNLFAALDATESAESERQSRVRAQFEARTGHPRGIVPLGEEGKLWAQLQADDPPDHAEADRLASAAIDTWLAGNEDDRARLRAFFARARYLRWRLGWPTGAAVGAIAAAGPDGAIESVQRALAGIVIDGAQSDWRDLIVSLDRLCLTAFRAGINPVPLIAAAIDALPVEPSSEPIRRVLAPYLAPDRAAALRRAARKGGGPGG